MMRSTVRATSVPTATRATASRTTARQQAVKINGSSGDEDNHEGHRAKAHCGKGNGNFTRRDHTGKAKDHVSDRGTTARSTTDGYDNGVASRRQRGIGHWETKPVPPAPSSSVKGGTNNDIYKSSLQRAHQVNGARQPEGDTPPRLQRGIWHWEPEPVHPALRSRGLGYFRGTSTRRGFAASVSEGDLGSLEPKPARLLHACHDGHTDQRGHTGSSNMAKSSRRSSRRPAPQVRRRSRQTVLRLRRHAQWRARQVKSPSQAGGTASAPPRPTLLKSAGSTSRTGSP